MKKNNYGKRGPQDSALQNVQPDKVGWIRKFCGKGIFRDIWKNRFVVLRGDQLFINEKEVKELGRADEVLDLSDYERCEEMRKNKSRSKKNHSKFRLQRSSCPGNTVPNLLFLAVSPEEKESWIQALNVAITRSKNRVLDEVTVEDAQLSHLTRDRVKIPHNRRLPTRGHLLAVASTSSSDGMLTLDLIPDDYAVPQEANGCENSRVQEGKVHLSRVCPQSRTDGSLSAGPEEASGKSHSLPRVREVAGEQSGPEQNPQPEKRLTSASMDEIPSSPEAKAESGPAAAPPIAQLQQLISQKLEKTERMLATVRGEGGAERGKVKVSAEAARAEAERLLKEASAAWTQAQEVLEEVKELRALYRQLDSPGLSSSNSTKLSPNRKSLM